MKYVEKAVTLGAQGAWAVFERLNRIKQNPAPTPKWSEKPLLKSYQKTKPPLGWPRAPPTPYARSVSPKFASRFSTANCPSKF